jgi:hypothetical protein
MFVWSEGYPGRIFINAKYHGGITQILILDILSFKTIDKILRVHSILPGYECYMCHLFSNNKRNKIANLYPELSLVPHLTLGRDCKSSLGNHVTIQNSEINNV